MTMLIDTIKEQINSHKIISFDMFDTLLLRPYVKPSDLFLHMEKIEKVPFYYSLRQEAEHNARLNHPDFEDVTFDMIYEEMDDKLKHLKQKEMDLEDLVLRANPELKQMYDYAKEQGKTIVIASDMYLPTAFLASILKKNGFDNWDKLYVSGDLGKTKNSGKMYRQILEDFKNIKPSSILHIGDNKKSDFKKPQELGISAIHYPSVMKQFLRQDKKAKLLKKQHHDSLGLSVFLGMLAYRWQLERFGLKPSCNYWQELGYRYAGPLAYGYTRFAESEAVEKNLNNLLFVARDGYLLQKIFTLFDNGIQHSYIYAPRILNLTCRLDYNPKNIFQSQAIVELFSEHSPKIKELSEKAKLRSAKDYHHFIHENRALFEPIAEVFLKNYKKYLSSKISSKDRLGLVDLITGEFSSQKLIQNSLHNHVTGMYWGVLASPFQGLFDYASYTKGETTQQTNRDVFTANWNFMEFLITSPEYPVKHLSPSGEPVYDKSPHPDEVWRAQNYSQIADSAVEFAEDIKEIFGNKDIFFTASDLVGWINVFIDHPAPKDIDKMSEVKFGMDSNHSDYVPLFSCKTPVSEFMRHPKKTLKKIKKLPWRSRSQHILVNILRPISCRIRGLKKIRITLLPHLQRKYFTVDLSITDNWFYKFVIGNSGKLKEK